MTGWSPATPPTAAATPLAVCWPWMMSSRRPPSSFTMVRKEPCPERTCTACRATSTATTWCISSRDSGACWESRWWPGTTAVASTFLVSVWCWWCVQVFVFVMNSYSCCCSVDLPRDTAGKLAGHCLCFEACSYADLVQLWDGWQAQLPSRCLESSRKANISLPTSLDPSVNWGHVCLCVQSMTPTIEADIHVLDRWLPAAELHPAYTIPKDKIEVSVRWLNSYSHKNLTDMVTVMLNSYMHENLTDLVTIT